ncbi:MAG: hypothetical protein AAFQ29_11060 [Pseudomonadota bacterium]
MTSLARHYPPNRALRPPCRRLRVMLRFADFCMDLGLYLIAQRPFPDNAKKTSQVIRAANRICKAGARLLAYVENPAPAKSGGAPDNTPAVTARRSRLIKQDVPFGEITPAPGNRSLQKRPPGVPQKMIEQTAIDANALARRIDYRTKAMIARDQHLRFGEGGRLVRSAPVEPSMPPPAIEPPDDPSAPLPPDFWDQAPGVASVPPDHRHNVRARRHPSRKLPDTPPPWPPPSRR